MVSTSPKIDQILAMVQELSQSERVGLIQRIMQMFLPGAEPAPTDTDSQDIAQESPYFSVHPQRQVMLQEEAAFDAMLDELRDKYLGQYVAMHGGAVIDHHKDIVTLSNQVRKTHPDQVVLIRQVLADPEPELRWRSIRFLDNS